MAHRITGWLAVVVACAACAPTSPGSAPGPGAGTEALPLLSTEIRLADFGLTSPEQIRHGRLTVALHTEGARLTVNSLRSSTVMAREVRATSAAPSLSDSGCFALGVATSPVANRLGGRFGTFALGASAARANLDADTAGAPGFTLACDRADGACGAWIHLFETGSLDRTYLDATDLESLALWVKGAEGDERVMVKMADAAWERRGDALALGELGRFIEGGVVSGEWRRARVPLDEIPFRVARDSLASLVFETLDAGSSELRLAGLELCAPGGMPAERPQGSATPRPRRDAVVHRALWVWNTGDLLRDRATRSDFLAFVDDGGFDRVFLYLAPAEGATAVQGFVPFDSPRLAVLLAELTALGVGTYALDGDPAYALPENHPGVLRTVDRVVEHNRSFPPEARFIGVRFNVEPYLLPGFQGPLRAGLLDGYIQLVHAIAARARPAGLRVGVDIPLWFDSPDQDTGEIPVAVLDGRRETILTHLFEQVDDVSVMGYRTSAYGADGSLVQVLGELEAAARTGAGVFVGLETGALPDEALVTFAGEPSSLGDAGAPVVAASAEINGLVRVWLVPARSVRELPGVGATGPNHAVPQFFWNAGAPSFIRARRLTFDRWDAPRLQAEAARIERELSAHPAFLGIAYHHYGSMADLQRRTDRDLDVSR